VTLKAATLNFSGEPRGSAFGLPLFVVT